MKESVKMMCEKYGFPVSLTVSLYLILKYAFWTAFPFIFAFIVAFIIRKSVIILISLTGLRVKEASFVLLFACYAVFFVILYLLLDLLLREGAKLAENIPQFYQKEIEPIISDFVNSNAVRNSLINLPLSEFKDVASSFVVDVSGKIANFALSLPDILVTATVTIISSFFLSLDYDNIKNNLMGILPLKIREKIFSAKRNVFLSLEKILKCYLLIFVVTFIELFIGLCLLKVRYPLITALLIAFADFLPLVGTGTVLIPWSFVSFIRGNSAFAVGVIALYLIITVIRNVIEPKILGKNIGIHPLLTLAAMYIGLKTEGVLLALMLPVCMLIFKAVKNDKQI